MSTISHLTINCQGLDYDLEFQAAREIVDFAARWCWHVYDKVAERLGPEEAAKTANKLQAKIFEQYRERLGHV